MKSESSNSGPEAKENVSNTNILTSKEVQALAKGAKVYEGILQVRRSVYLGQIKYQYWWANNGGIFYCYATQYTINDPDKQGRNKANIHFSFDSSQWWGNDSPDSMRQDNQWHTWAVGGWVGANQRARVFARFTFDLPGHDDSAENSVIYTYS